MILDLRFVIYDLRLMILDLRCVNLLKSKIVNRQSKID